MSHLRFFVAKKSFVGNTGFLCFFHPDFYSDIDDFTPDFVQISALVISDWDTRKDLRGQKKL